MGNEIILTLVAQATWAVPLIVGLVEIIKRIFNNDDFNKRWLPALSVVIGLVVGLVVVELSITGALVGLILGLGATGLWEFGKTTIAGR